MVGHIRTLLRECLAEVGLAAPVIEKVGAYPPPTVLIDGQDVMGDPGVVPAPRPCRVHTPTRARLLAALLHAGTTRGETEQVDTLAVHDKMEQARARFHPVLDRFSDAALE